MPAEKQMSTLNDLDIQVQKMDSIWQKRVPSDLKTNIMNKKKMNSWKQVNLKDLVNDLQDRNQKFDQNRFNPEVATNLKRR